MTSKDNIMSISNKIHILFFSLWTIEFIVTLLAAVKGLSGLMWVGIASGILTLILCIGLRIKYVEE